MSGNENNMNEEKKSWEVTDLNSNEMQEDVSNQLSGNRYEETDWASVGVAKKEGFFSKHKFAFGLFAGIGCVLLVLFGAFQILKLSGQIIVIGGTGVHEVDNSDLLDSETVEKLNEIFTYMNIYYYEDFEISDIQGSLFDGLMEGLEDPYSVYYTPEEYEDLMVSTSGTYYGIGAGLTQDPDTMQVTISKVYRGTPSEEAGLKNGDIILSVEGIDASSIEVSKLVQEIRGDEGTYVDMVIYRESTGETLEFSVQRRNVELPSIEGELLDGGIGYIQILEFQSKTDEQFVEMVESLKEQGMKGMIIDVRANPGGLLSSVVNMLDYVLPSGLITYVEDAYGNKQEYTSGASCVDMPIVLLVDGNSASASEIFAGAIKDYGYGTLVGETTFGKGIVQTIISLSDGDAIKLTTAKYFTPLGNYIHGVGIEPDVEAAYEYSGPEDEDYDKQYDSQFLKALEIMKEKLADE